MSDITKFLLGGAMTAALIAPGAALATPVALSATLSGANETKGGDADGSGVFAGQLDQATGDLCYTLSVAGITAPVAAHIHSGAAGQDGPPVVPVQVTGKDDDQCVAVEPDALKPIVAAPGDYYVNVHTKDFPAGAVRGQLSAPAK